MKIIETSVFTKRLKILLSDEDYRKLQNEIILNPEKGKIIIGSGGLRKIRWSIPGKGKSGGVRIIYYWAKAKEIILMLLMYSKNEQDDLSNEQLKMLKSLVEKEFK
ncbi:MAG: type II toxin-antitoxin system RelE/ParE family toxin [Ignavibacteriales bacterium]|nr:type II toxin-antitoxin system RelE/ParE family toxin [Ignavibacteriales bacterium]